MDIRRTVLLADANEEFRTLVRKIIDETEEFSVVGSVGDGTEALRLAREEAPDLILMDVVLPGLDGFGVLKQLREQEGKVPKVILISAFCSDSVVSEAVDLGASYFLTKPVEENALLDRMRALFSRGAPVEEHPAELKNLVTSVIHEIGVPAHIKGYQYLREAIMIAVDDMDVIQIDKLTNAGEKYFFKMLMKADTNIAWGEDVILLDGRVAAKASVSGTTIAMKTPVETVEVTPSENSTYSVTGDGVIIGASLTLANKSVDKKATIDGIDVKGGETASLGYDGKKWFKS